jgi:hypothetical protein
MKKLDAQMELSKNEMKNRGKDMHFRKLGEFQGIPIYEIHAYTDLDLVNPHSFQVYNNNVFCCGEKIGELDRMGGVDWMISGTDLMKMINEVHTAREERPKPQPVRDAAKEPERTEWDDMLKPVDDVLNELLSREL